MYRFLTLQFAFPMQGGLCRLLDERRMKLRENSHDFEQYRSP